MLYVSSFLTDRKSFAHFLRPSGCALESLELNFPKESNVVSSDMDSVGLLVPDPKEDVVELLLTFDSSKMSVFGIKDDDWDDAFNST